MIKPILFNTEMVRAILKGRKTVTRRIVKPQPQCSIPADCRCLGCKGAVSGICNKTDLDFPKQPYQPGDILYVRESFAEWTDGYVYKAGTLPFAQPGEFALMKWCPSIHMPKEAARIWLRVTDVRVERLQDITLEESLKEGMTDIWIDEARPLRLIEAAGNKNEFTDRWNSTIKKSDLDRYGWDENPWVWVIEFERCEKPESEV